MYNSARKSLCPQECVTVQIIQYFKEAIIRLFVNVSRKILNLERRLELAESSRSVNLEKLLDEVRGVVSDSELSEKMVEIQNQVAELEEEKGNLQLKLVEYEELAGI